MGGKSSQRSVSKAMAVCRSDLRKLLSEQPFISGYGFRLQSIAAGECILTVPFQPAFERPGGIVSGLVFMAAADVAMWLAIKTLLGRDDGCVTAEMKTSFLSAAKQQDFRCRARILKLGKRLVYGVAECISLDRKLLTHHTLTYIRPGTERG
jgi:acyl-coenzyme A thioesterase PaaI-like protein